MGDFSYSPPLNKLFQKALCDNPVTSWPPKWGSKSMILEGIFCEKKVEKKLIFGQGLYIRYVKQ